MKKSKESGFSLIETIFALLILMIGILATISALSFSIFYVQESEKNTYAREYARSALETIFSIRDLQLFDAEGNNVTYNWDTLVVKNTTNSGIFTDDWTPIRESPGKDGIYGTADDTCAETENCVVGGATNSSAVVNGYQRKIEITDIVKNGTVRERYIVIRVRYMVGLNQREISESTIIANLPTNS
jgi:Tfp pilus assembly protein PilV